MHKCTNEWRNKEMKQNHIFRYKNKWMNEWINKKKKHEKKIKKNKLLINSLTENKKTVNWIK